MLNGYFLQKKELYLNYFVVFYIFTTLSTAIFFYVVFYLYFITVAGGQLYIFDYICDRGKSVECRQACPQCHSFGSLEAVNLGLVF